MTYRNCVQRNHVYLCDRKTVVQKDLKESCLGSLYLRQQDGIRKHCKFEKKPVQEIFYQLTDTEHLIYSPVLQTTAIKCRNNSATIVYVDQATRVVVPQGCSLDLEKHAIHSERQTTINPHPLHSTWTWDPLSLPSTMLEEPEHKIDLRSDGRTDGRTKGKSGEVWFRTLRTLRKIVTKNAYIALLAFAYGCPYIRRFSTAPETKPTKKEIKYLKAKKFTRTDLEC